MNSYVPLPTLHRPHGPGRMAMHIHDALFTQHATCVSIWAEKQVFFCFSSPGVPHELVNSLFLVKDRHLCMVRHLCALGLLVALLVSLGLGLYLCLFGFACIFVK
jgi:hypothetical protein